MTIRSFVPAGVASTAGTAARTGVAAPAGLWHGLKVNALALVTTFSRGVSVNQLTHPIGIDGSNLAPITLQLFSDPRLSEQVCLSPLFFQCT